MSTCWGYYCQICNTETDHWFNHGEDKLAEYIAARRMFKQSGYDFTWVSLSILGGDWALGEMDSFLTEHENHEIALKNEYGDVVDLPEVKKESRQIETLLGSPVVESDNLPDIGDITLGPPLL